MIKSFSEFILEAANYNNQGYSSTIIKSIQKKLIDEKLLASLNSKKLTNIDGKFGSLSKAALQQYQQGKSLKNQSGNITDETLKLMGLSAQKSSTQNKTQITKQELPKLGNFTLAKDITAPLILVYGGIPVGGRESGVYMYDYFNKTGDKYNLFVAKNHKVDGLEAYKNIKSKIDNGEISPSKKILYLFSAGYRPGKTLLSSVSSNEFEKIFLVDIWMANYEISEFYKKLAQNNKSKVEYYYTDGGSGGGKFGDSARDSIIKSVATSKKTRYSDYSSGMNAHMATNINAVDRILSLYP